jgi:hypothetical protein
MRFKLSEKEYENIIKKKNIKINGSLKSSLRKKSPEISYKNFIKSDYMIDSDYMFSEYIKMKKANRYRPKVIFLQILLNLLLITVGFYFFKQDLLFEIFFIAMVMFINWFIVWIYSLISTLKNSFRKKSNKFIWLLLLILMPFTAFFYPDFRKIQIE